jgi:hypothetical protein
VGKPIDRGGELSAERAQRRSRRFVTRCIDEIRDCFCLREIELAFEEGAARKFPRLGEAGSGVEARAQHRLHDDRTAMALQLEHGFSRV